MINLYGKQWVRFGEERGQTIAGEIILLPNNHTFYIRP
jgi:hypothetical protein